MPPTPAIRAHPSRLCPIVLAVGALGLAGPASSQTYSADAAPLFMDGELTGCSIVFDVTFADYRYRGGQATHAAGSINLVAVEDGSLVLGLRLGLAPAQALDAPFEAPGSAYLVDDLDTNLAELVDAFESDVPGYANWAFRLGDRTAQALMSASSGTFTVAYTRVGGVSAQTFDVSVEASERVDFGRCLDRVLGGQ